MRSRSPRSTTTSTLVEHLEVAVAHRQALALQHQAPRAAAAAGTARAPSGRRGGVDLGALEAHDPLLDAVGHRRLGGLGAEAVDERLQPVDLLGLALGQLGQPDLVLLPRHEVLAVGALVLLDRADAGLVVALEVEHAGDGLVEQVEVVADHEQRAPVGAHEAEQPVLGVAVEVVGGLVEEQHVAAGEQDAGDLDPSPLAARQRADRLVEAVGFEAEPGGDAADLALGRVAALEAEPLLGAGEPVHGALGRVLLHLEAQLLDAHHRLVEARVPRGCGARPAWRRRRRRGEGPAAGSRGRRCGARRRRRGRPPRRGPSAGWSCRRRCGRRARPCRGRGSRSWRPRG